MCKEQATRGEAVLTFKNSIHNTKTLNTIKMLEEAMDLYPIQSRENSVINKSYHPRNSKQGPYQLTYNELGFVVFINLTL